MFAGDGVKDRSAVQRRLEEAGLTRKIGSNQVRATRINVSGTHDDKKRIEEEGRLDEWCADMRVGSAFFGMMKRSMCAVVHASIYDRSKYLEAALSAYLFEYLIAASVTRNVKTWPS